MASRPIRSILFCVAAVSLAGCGSLTSPSEWVAGSSNAIAGSIQAISRSSGSGGGSAGLAYQRDVREWAAEVARSGSTQDEFLRGIGRIAESHGLTHWQAEPATLIAIGEGLSDAGWTAVQVEQLRNALVLEGYRQAGS